MNYCKNYDIDCIFALSENAPSPCFGDNEQCGAWRSRPDVFTKGAGWKLVGDNGIGRIFKENVAGQSVGD